MSFYSSLINWIRGFRNNNHSVYIDGNKYVFGTILSGNYSKYKTDPQPTILCLGNYFNPIKNSWKLHGIQLHHMRPDDLQWLMQQILIWKKNGAVIDPRSFYNYLKNSKKYIIDTAYRTYNTEFVSFKAISPGMSNVTFDYCCEPFDTRDGIIREFNKLIRTPAKINNYEQASEIQNQYNTEALNARISEIQNSRKLW